MYFYSFHDGDAEKRNVLKGGCIRINETHGLNEMKLLILTPKLQKQPSRGSVNMFWKYLANLRENIHNEVGFQETCKATLLKSHFGMRGSPVNLLHIFKTPFPKNTYGGLLLLIGFCEAAWSKKSDLD